VESLARIYVEAYGCSANLADSEMVQGLLGEAGHTIVEEPENAHASVILSCTVKTPTQNKVAKRIRAISRLEKPLVVAGCMPKAQEEFVEEIAPSACLMAPDNLTEIVEVVESALRGERVEALEGGVPDRTCLPRVRANSVVHISPIASGCLGDCSYCIVKKARGDLHSYPASDIVEDARRAVEAGCREIWVTAEDTAAYRHDGVRLPGLLEMLCDLEGRFLIRVGMMTPNQALPILDDLLDAYRAEKVFRFLHVPVQAGNDEVLGRMRRRYSVEEFRRLVRGFREGHPMLSLSTDVICGFPGETNAQFGDSLRLVEEVRPDVLNISRFWGRPGTDAVEMEGQLHGRVTKERSRRLSSLWQRLSLEANRRWVGWEGEVLVDEAGRSGGMVARNPSYKPVVLKEPLGLGKFFSVRIVGATRGYLLGETV